MRESTSTNASHRLERRVALVTVVTPFIGFVIAVILLFGQQVSVLDLLLCAVFYGLTMLGITAGFHRLFTHRSFKCSPPAAVFLGIAGCMAAEGPILFWCASHRRHHQCSDKEGDPHSPHGMSSPVIGTLRSWWHAHTGWMFNHQKENYLRVVPDLLADKQVVYIDRCYFLWVALGLLLPALISAGFTHSWAGFFSGLLWGGFVRLFLVHHSTWSINSICHLFGSSPYETADKSRNNALCALMALGEGWHNNHHAFPTSARHGLGRWEVDVTFVFIKVLRFLGLASDIRVPTAQQVAQRRKKDEAATCKTRHGE